MREKFEKYQLDNHLMRPEDFRLDETGAYFYIGVIAAWKLWQAAYRTGLEDAAKIANAAKEHALWERDQSCTSSEHGQWSLVAAQCQVIENGIAILKEAKDQTFSTFLQSPYS